MQNLKDGRSAFVEGFRYGTFLQKEFPSDAYTDTTIVVTDSVWQEDIEYMKEEYEFDLATEWERSLMIPRSIGALNMIQKDNIPIFGIAVNLYYDKLIKAIPKIFFVLVIFLALLTSLFSVRKTSESLIFAVHFQSFVFLSSSIFLLLVSFIDLIYPNDDILDLLIGVFVFCILLYFAKCFNSFNSKNNYFLSALKASLIWIFYGVLALGAITLFIFYKAWY